jgi:ABC-type transporter Mla subunit MlaD
MAAPINHYKLGFFVLLVMGAVIVSVVAIGATGAHHPSAVFSTYFDESVGGLGSGASVAFRGVALGSVSAISIAPDHRHVEVKYDIDLALLGKIGITARMEEHATHYDVPPDLRAQVGANGLTGAKHVAIDVFDPKDNPPPVLPFAVGSNYIPAATSTMKSLEDSLTKAADRVPELVAAIVSAAGRVDDVLAHLEQDEVPGKAAATLKNADNAFGALTATIRRFDRERVPEKTSKALDDMRAAVARVDHVLDQLDGEGGVLTSVRRTTDAFGQLGRGASSSVRDLDQVLEELRDAAAAIRVLAEDLHRDPDMLLKGRPMRPSR